MSEIRQTVNLRLLKVADALNKVEISPLFNNYQYGRYCRDWELNYHRSVALERDLVQDYMQKKTETSWFLYNNDELIGFLGLGISDWDTNFWGFPYAIIDYSIIKNEDSYIRRTASQFLAEWVTEWCKNNNIAIAVIRIDSNDLENIWAYELEGFHYVETTITNSIDLRAIKFQTQGKSVFRLAKPEEAEMLVEMSDNAFVTHRFYADTNFDSNKVDEFYKVWVKNSISNTNVWKTMVLEVDKTVLGFMTYTIDDLSEYFGLKFVKWRMACLKPIARGGNFGSELFIGAMEFERNNASIVDSGLTIRNIHSFNLHTKLNFKLKSSSVTLHKWFSEQNNHRSPAIY